jgi:hypothetical protein
MEHRFTAAQQPEAGGGQLGADFIPSGYLNLMPVRPEANGPASPVTGSRSSRVPLDLPPCAS